MTTETETSGTTTGTAATIEIDGLTFTRYGDDRLREECGVFGIFDHPDAAAITALGLHALQHRGQEAAGIVTYDGRQFHSERRMGLVGDNFSQGRRDRPPQGPHGRRPQPLFDHRRAADRATCSRCSPTSIPAASPSPTTAT